MFLLLHFTFIEANDGGFNVKLIRKKSPHILSRRVLKGSPNTQIVQTKTNAYLGEYLMELSIGTPPVTIFGTVDTGSDLIWTQCVPCDNCYKQLNPLFDPRKSNTYTNISCQSNHCKKLISMCSPQNGCNYTYDYADSSRTQGALAQETLTLTSSTGKPVVLKDVVFGCGHNDTGVFDDHEMGIIGLGGGPLSLISQIGSSFGGKRFSQCLLPFNTDEKISSRMSFGKGSEVSGPGVVSTPLVDAPIPTPYLVTLLGISVGHTYFPFSSSSNTVRKGNMNIDSGTPPTILPQDLYDRVAAQVEKQVNLTPIRDDPDLGTQLCYRTTKNLNGPTLTAHFEGADVLLTPIQIFIPPKDGVFCFAFANDTGEVGIYGNFAQSNYLIGYDLDKKVVSFKPADCTKH
ncbi:hypothetical protein VNO77_41459 [Canavalia gladiata]|uniref:Peptidase A1 domain-containing protein n=1 Tax=Canavalia gladiata TaxID=3824 RepID=A0AAN9K174_CANGL